MMTALIAGLALLLIGSLPLWPHSRQWGYTPSGGIGVVLILVGILVYLRLI
jgi:hypothetical protein